MELAQPVGESMRQRPPTKRMIPIAVGIAAVAASCVAWAYIQFGSIRDAWLYAGGARVVIDRATLILPTGKVGDTQEAVFEIRNLASGPVRVLGATVSCDCVTTEGLPVEVAAGESRRLRSTLHLDARMSGLFEQSVTYFTDHPSAPSLRVVIRGRVLTPETKGGATLDEGK